jgi:hypothetical protein
MNWQEAEQLAERIRVEAPKQIAVVGIEPVGPGDPAYATAFSVKCACKITGLRFLVQSLQHWMYLNQGHAIVRLCKMAYELMKK